MAFQDLPDASDDRLRTLITTAVDAAKSAGATYADSRLTFSQEVGIGGEMLISSVYGPIHLSVLTGTENIYIFSVLISRRTPYA